MLYHIYIYYILSRRDINRIIDRPKHLFTQSSIHPVTYPHSHLSTQSIHTVIYPPNHLSALSSVHPIINSHSPVSYPSNHLFTQSSHLCTQSSIHTIHPMVYPQSPIHAIIYPSNYLSRTVCCIFCQETV